MQSITKRNNTNKWLIAGAIFCLLSFGSAIYLVNIPQKKAPEVVQEDPTPKTEVDPAILPMANELGLQTEGLKIQYVDHLTALAEGQSLVGLYDENRTISLLKDQDVQTSTKPALAHEYLHYVWDKKMTPEEKTTLTTQLTNLYNGDYGMSGRMSKYTYLTVGSQDFATELFSIYCTESSDGYLSPEVLTKCNKWINRGAITFKR